MISAKSLKVRKNLSDKNSPIVTLLLDYGSICSVKYDDDHVIIGLNNGQFFLATMESWKHYYCMQP